MSALLFKEDVLFLQRILAVSGFYTGKLDGKWSAAVELAEAAFEAEFEKIKKEEGEFDARSEANIRTLVPAAQRKARQFLKAVAGRPLTYRILSGTRTYAEQDALFAKVPRVTKARGGQSNHNFGIAWDVGIFENGKYYTGATKKENQAYQELGAFITAKVPGVAWGGNWKTFPDQPHYELATGKSVKDLRALLEAGKSYA